MCFKFLGRRKIIEWTLTHFSFSLLSIFVRHVDFYFCTFSVAPPSFLPRTCLMYDFKHACTWYTVQCCAISVIMRTVSSPKFILLFTVNWNQANKILQMWIKEVGDGLPVKCSNPVSWRGGCFQSCGPMTLRSTIPRRRDLSLQHRFLLQPDKNIEGSFAPPLRKWKTIAKGAQPGLGPTIFRTGSAVFSLRKFLCIETSKTEVIPYKELTRVPHRRNIAPRSRKAEQM